MFGGGAKPPEESGIPFQYVQCALRPGLPADLETARLFLYNNVVLHPLCAAHLRRRPGLRCGIFWRWE